ncbi:MAG: class I SAM-dependent methyltransferase [Eubacterium sp.]|nr:class I SAM-dependent methyltransferase [Eubacterium sp.]
MEIGAGTLNQINYERTAVYDIIEPFRLLYRNSSNLKYVRNIYADISEIKNEKYDRITSIACFEHVEDLPEMVRITTQLLNKKGKLYVSIPNEGRFLWKLAYTVTTGREFEKRYGLKYETMIRHEHINTADEIELILKYYYKNVKTSFLGIGRTFSIFRYYECSEPKEV